MYNLSWNCEKRLAAPTCFHRQTYGYVHSKQLNRKLKLKIYCDAGISEELDSKSTDLPLCEKCSDEWNYDIDGRLL